MDERGRAVLAELVRRGKRGPARYCPHEPTSKQRAFVDYEGLEALYGGAAGGGKSDALLMAALKYVHVPGYSALLLRKSYPDLALPGAIMDRASTWLSGTNAHWDGINKRWSFPIKKGEQDAGVSTLSFGYLKDENDHLRYQGSELHYVGFDEVTQFREKHYAYLFSRLRRRAGVDVPLRMRGATNPGGPGHVWVKGRFGIPNDVDMSRPHFYQHPTLGELAFFPAKLDDNPHVDREEYERALSKLDSITQSQLRHGSWKQDSSTLVYKLERYRHGIAQLPTLGRRMEWSYVLGIDYGNVNATAFVVLAFCAAFTDVVYIVESDKWSKLIPSTAAKLVDKWSKRYPFVRIVGDVGGLGKGYAEEGRRRFALPIEPAQKQNKLGYIKLFNGACENDEIKVVSAGNEKYFEEVEGLPWKNEQQQEELPGAANHLCDGALYGWRECRGFLHAAEDEKPPPGTPEHDELLEREAEEADEEAIREEEEWDGMV